MTTTFAGRFPLTEDSSRAELTKIARQIFVARRKRREMLPKSLIREYAWDMLLALYIFDRQGPKFTVSRLIEFAAVPSTTALRWIAYLENEKFVFRAGHPTDARASYIAISELGRATLDAYISDTFVSEK